MNQLDDIHFIFNCEIRLNLKSPNLIKFIHENSACVPVLAIDHNADRGNHTFFICILFQRSFAAGLNCCMKQTHYLAKIAEYMIILRCKPNPNWAGWVPIFGKLQGVLKIACKYTSPITVTSPLQAMGMGG